MDEKSYIMLEHARKEGLPLFCQGDFQTKQLNEPLSSFSGWIVHGEVIDASQGVQPK